MDMSGGSVQIDRETTPSPLNFILSDEEEKDRFKEAMEKFLEDITGTCEADDESEPKFLDSPLHTSVEDGKTNLDTLNSEDKCMVKKRKRIAKRTATWIPSRRQKKPKGMPKRPLSAYNLFFRSQRAKIITETEMASQGTTKKVTFEQLGKLIGKKWRELGLIDREMYSEAAESESNRYRKEMKAYRKMKNRSTKQFNEETSSKLPTVPVDTIDESVPTNSSLRIGHSRGIESDSLYSQQQVSTSLHASNPKISAFASVGVRKTCSPVIASSSTPIHNVARWSSSTLVEELGTRQYNLKSPTSPPPTSSQLSRDYQSLEQVLPTTLLLSQVTNPSLLPPGMEIIVIEDGVQRKYRVEYKCFSMASEVALQYFESLARRRGGFGL